MFVALAEIALHTPITFTVTREHDCLHVIIAGKGDKPLAFATPVRVTGTPEELDAQLPAQLAAYAGQMQAPATAIALPAPAKPAAKERTLTPRPPAKAKKPAKAAPKKTDSTEARKKPARSSVGNAGAASLKRAARQSKAEGPSRAAGGSPALPGKPECLADLAALQAKHGAKLTRRTFIKEAATGRRYEKLWKNFEAFVAAAAPAPSPNADLFAEQATTTTVAIASTAAWPFPDPASFNAAAPAGAEAGLPPEATEATTTPVAAAPDKPRIIGPTAEARPITATEDAHEPDRNGA